MVPVRRLGALAGAIAFAATAGTALAATKTYCVTTPSAPPGCSGTQVSNFADALLAADADSGGSDQIVLPAGTQTGIVPYQYTGTASLEIDGQGPTSIITLVGAFPSSAVFSDTNGSAGTTLHSLEVAIPAGSDGTADGIHLHSSSPTISDVTVTDNGSDAAYGIVLDEGGTISSTTDEMPPNTSGPSAALTVPNGTIHVTDSTLTGNAGVVIDPGVTASILRCDIASNNGPALSVTDGVASIQDSYLNATSDAAIRATAVLHASTVLGSFLTIGPNLNGSGLSALVEGNFNATVGVSDSIIASPHVDSISTQRASGTGVPSVTTSNSDYDPTTITTYNGAPYVPGTHDLPAYVDPKFAGLFDFHLLAGSPLIGYDARSLGFLDTPNDLSGFPRPVNGPQDLGAYQHPPNPTVSASVSDPSHSTVYPGTTLAFSASGSEQYPNDTLTYTWKFDDGATVNGQNVNHSFATAGSHTATVTATDQYGFSASAQTSATVTPTPPGAPVVGHLTESHKRFRTSRRTATITAKRHRRHRAPVGTVFSFTLDQSATLFITFSPGRGHGFARLVKLPGHPGTDHVAFYGRVHGFTLKPRKYTLIVKALNAYGETSKPVTLTFTIVR